QRTKKNTFRTRNRIALQKTFGRRKSGIIRKNEKWRIPRRKPRFACKSRYDFAQYEYARPCDVPRFAQGTSPQRRQMENLSDVRLGTRRIGLYRGNFAFALFARIRKSPSAL